MNPLPTIPEHLEVIESLKGTIIRKKWLTWMVAPLVLFVIVWDSFLFFWYQQAFSNASSPLIMKIFPLGHLAVGIGLTYYVLASFFNKTDVILNPSCIEVATGPFPWIGNKRLFEHEIRHILVRELLNRSNTGSHITCHVMYAGDDRKEKRLLSSLRPDHAEFIAESVRQTLKLQ